MKKFKKEKIITYNEGVPSEPSLSPLAVLFSLTYLTIGISFSRKKKRQKQKAIKFLGPGHSFLQGSGRPYLLPITTGSVLLGPHHS